jgi:hypothetical protein
VKDVALVVLVLACAWLAAVLVARRRGRPAPGARRILFPLAGGTLSEPALDATLRLARAEGATLVPAFLARVPLSLPLHTALPRQSNQAMPLLEAIEQRAAREHVAVDSRIERGRTYRHAIRELITHERYDRIVVAAAGGGFDTDDIAWLLDHAPGEIVVVRPAVSAPAAGRGRRPAPPVPRRRAGARPRPPGAPAPARAPGRPTG